MRPTILAQKLPKSFLAIAAWMISLIFLLTLLMIQFSSGMMIEPLSKSFDLNTTWASLLASSFFYIYALMQIPIGMIIDQYGARRVMLIGGILGAISCEVFASAHVFWIAEASRIVLGAGLSGIFISLVFLLGRWFNQTKFNRFFAISEAIATLSIVCGNLTVAHWLQTTGWRASMHYISCILATLAVLTFFFVFDGPKKDDQNNLTYRDHFHHIKILCSNRYAWSCALYCGTMFCSDTVFVGLWAYPLFMAAYPLTPTDAIYISGMAMAGLAAGCLMIPRLLNQDQTLKALLYTGPLLVTSMLWAILVYIDRPLWELVIEMLVMGLASSTYLLGYVLLHRNIPSTMKSTAIGFANAICVAFPPLLQPLIGVLIDWHHATHYLTISPSKENYQWALYWLMGFILVVGTLSARGLSRPNQS